MFSDSSLLGEVKLRVFEKLTQVKRAKSGRIVPGEGFSCPACTQWVKLSVRTLDDGISKALILMYRAGPDQFHHLPSLSGDSSGHTQKAFHFGLIEPDGRVHKRDSNPRNGKWRLTELGKKFVLGQASVQRWVVLYNTEKYASDGPLIDIHEAIGHKFNYAEMMGWRDESPPAN